MTEHDPTGLGAHEAGAKLDAGKLKPSLITRDMADALRAVIEVATKGAEKYSERGWKYVPSAVDRYSDALMRHELDTLQDRFSRDNAEGGIGTLHAAQVAWNALARLQLILEQERYLEK